MKRILIVEDDQSFSRVMEYFLLKEGYGVVTLSSGRAALAYIRRGKPTDLVILDLKLPDMEGLNLMERIKECIDIPIVINSGYPHHKSDFVSWLADAYLVKQSDLGELKETVRSILR